MDRPNITLTYNWPPENTTKKYRHETNVTFSCPEHYPIGGDTYGVCRYGEWKTKLSWGWEPTLPGWCQQQCDAEKLRKDKGYGPHLRSGESSKFLIKGNKYQWVESGTTISVFCERLSFPLNNHPMDPTDTCVRQIVWVLKNTFSSGTCADPLFESRTNEAERIKYLFRRPVGDICAVCLIRLFWSHTWADISPAVDLMREFVSFI
ncbi:unnamed protein product [Heligmosomoides polygyrus]|uniref:Sushi domain-containing protein n=1 Tax=Heligmosomoides polygyrus TaxID=6339 RepID=A0A183GJL1_HELPZ|nr:unnamed protein product [Heligmosomoides polygyrus]